VPVALVMREPMLNPMHPPLAKKLITLSIHSFGDGRLVGAIRACCSDSSPLVRCICAGWRCSRRKDRRLLQACWYLQPDAVRGEPSCCVAAATKSKSACRKRQAD
jgi:hypothetical protein